jgi:hypothetical protein
LVCYLVKTGFLCVESYAYALAVDDLTGVVGVAVACGVRSPGVGRLVVLVNGYVLLVCRYYEVGIVRGCVENGFCLTVLAVDNRRCGL